jgi:glycosyltransferase involved in cell wall biosynthesis
MKGRKVKGQKMSSVSVVIPCYNYARFLEGCVQSVLSQADVDVRILIIDDGSTDCSAKVGANLAASDSRVAFRRHEINQGHLQTYNEGLAWASGTYTALLSVDDRLVPGALGRASAVMDAHPDVGLVYGRAVYFESDDQLPRARAGVPRLRLWKGEDWIGRRCITATNCISSPEVVVRTTLQHELGGYRADLPHSGDLEMWLRFAAHADIAYLQDVDQAYYRIHATSMLRTRFADRLSDLQQRKAAFDAVFEEHGVFLKGAPLMWAKANRALAREALWAACRTFDRRRYDEDLVTGLEAFAIQTYPQAIRLPEYAGLRWRKVVGPRWCPWLQPLLVSPALRKVRNQVSWRRLNACGV